jgi:hypothetical protein
MQYFRLPLIVRLNSRWFYARYACDDCTCTYLIMLKQLSAGGCLRQELSRPLLELALKVMSSRFLLAWELYIILTYAVLREFY